MLCSTTVDVALFCAQNINTQYKSSAQSSVFLNETEHNKRGTTRDVQMFKNINTVSFQKEFHRSSPVSVIIGENNFVGIRRHFYKFFKLPFVDVSDRLKICVLRIVISQNYDGGTAKLGTNSEGRHDV